MEPVVVSEEHSAEYWLALVEKVAEASIPGQSPVPAWVLALVEPSPAAMEL